jgi:hypothetical protein
MKTVWIASLAAALSTTAIAQTTIYKLVDESGRVTYSNKPMKGAVVLDLEPLTTVPGSSATPPSPKADANEKAAARARPAVAIVTPVASVDPQLQKRRDDERRRILETELDRENESLGEARKLLEQEQQNPSLVAAVRVAQQASEPSPAELMEFRKTIDKASGRIRGLQATVAEHEKNVEALKKELGALKP